MAQSPKTKPVSYSEVVRTLNDKDVQEDMNNACTKLAQAMSKMMGKFDAIAKQMHTIDLLRHAAPLKPKWDSMRKELTDLVWQFRTNAGIISGRMKLFSSAVLPIVARSLEERSGRSSPDNESLQVLQSYVAISAEHSSHARTLVDRTLKFSTNLVTFVTEFTKLARRHAVNGQKEMCDLSDALSELEAHVQRLLFATRDVNSADPAHVLYATSRLVLSSGRPSGGSKLTRRQMILEGDLNDVGRAYENSDRKRNEVAHAQYAAQLRQTRNDNLSTTQTTLCGFLLEELLTTESALSVFLSAWSRLRSDCTEIFQWLKDPSQSTPPLAISSYKETLGSSLYVPLANALDIYAAGVESSISTSRT